MKAFLPEPPNQLLERSLRVVFGMAPSRLFGMAEQRLLLLW